MMRKTTKKKHSKKTGEKSENIGVTTGDDAKKKEKGREKEGYKSLFTGWRWKRNGNLKTVCYQSKSRRKTRRDYTSTNEITGLPLNIVRSRSGAVHSQNSSALQEGEGKRTSSTASQHRAPSEQRHLKRDRMYGPRCAPGLGLGQLSQAIPLSSDHLPHTSLARTTNRARP